MLEDEQRFEELEAKLAALSSQVEGLELEKEVDPFLEDDVRRLIEDFREKEIAELEDEGEDLEDSDELGGNDFIDVQTTGGRTFKVHWIAPDSCDNMTKTTARAAFSAGAAERYGTSQQVNSGDVLILLCRKPTSSEAPAKFCQYIGMAVNTGLSPTSAEPPATDVESMTSAVGNYEIFVWSSCECSAESSEPVTITSLTPDSSSSTSDSYAKVGSDGSSISESVDGLLTDLEVTNTGEQAPLNPLDSTVLKDETLSVNEAGFKANLVSLSEKLTDYYVNYSSKSLSFDASTKNIDSLNFNADSFQSKTLELTGSECGGLQSVSLGSNSLELIKAGSSVSSSTSFVNSAQVSLGVSIYNDGAQDGINFIPSYRAETVDNINHPDAKKLFLPLVSDANAEAIEISDSISYLENYELTIEARYTVVYESEGKGDAEYYFYKKEKKVNDAKFASGLFYDNSTASEDTEKQLLGIIRVKDTPLRYGCHETYGCQLDPAGEYDDPGCGSGCANTAPQQILTYRPAKILKFDPNQSTTLPIEIHDLDPFNALIDSQGYGPAGSLYLDAQGRLIFNQSVLGEPNTYGVYYTAG